MLKITFKNVGQGDSIIIEWEINGEKHLGIIDSNLYNEGNPVLEHLKEKTPEVIDFIILTHFHYDHFSGFSEVFRYCIDKKIKVKIFAHTLISHVFDIYNRIFTSKKIEKAVSVFFNVIDDFIDILEEDVVEVNSRTASIKLTDKVSLSFYAPSGKVGLQFAKNMSRKYVNIQYSGPDINKLSIISALEDSDKVVLLTSDAVRNSFKFENKFSSKRLIAIQIPHHGSFNNINPNFWNSVNKNDSCPAILSVGDEPKDKLPNKETVEYFDKQGYDIHSTNFVYGLCEYLKKHSDNSYKTKISCLDTFAAKNIVRGVDNVRSSKYNGDKVFTFFPE